MRPIYARFAVTWLEEQLLPLALATAGTTSAPLPAVNDPDIPFYANAEAGTLCTQRPLFCAALLAAELGDTPHARELADRIARLMWKDAVEMAVARDLDMALNLDAVTDREAEDRCYRAMDLWGRWAATDEPARASQQTFLEDCADQYLAETMPRD